ncbi:hypothetical protein TFKS16_2328 [Tannerella forsythia KS16]|uniref:DUF3883 domain-containing protein n=1 Tax=Bacteroidales TaxID=171549 RepID=UPI000618BB0D|nr:MULTISPECIES: DUF3883 domain-containing protein [Bacteroidales]OWR83067.1 hypothetical protein SJDPG12_03285 [Porphyromonas gingivalis SJD12]BAR52524.1 hypothetical protein TFKS16_2328 [Tannerella forsythia KS16]
MNNNILAIIVAFYLSKFNQEGVRNLGFNSFNEVFDKTANLLNVKRNYVKLRRDEFDPIYPWRQGWKRPMDKRIIRTIEILDELEEPDVRDIVSNILYNPFYRETEDLKNIVNLIKHTEKSKVEMGNFILRCPTGKAAEEFFYNFYIQNQLPIKGNLSDCRDLGCGYDYKITDTNSNEFYIEVKGISDMSGGILFTDKEWKIAMKQKKRYFLCIVRNLNNKPELEFINNPSQFIKPTKNIRTTLQINWSVSDKELKSINNNS